MRELVKGTVENIAVDVADKSGQIEDLETLNPTYKVRLRADAEQGSWIVAGSPAVADGMTALCLVDTTTWDIGFYQLFLSFENSPEIPMVGPIEFKLAHGDPEISHDTPVL